MSDSPFKQFQPTAFNFCMGRFSDKGQKCDISPNLPLGSQFFRSVYCGESSPKVQIYNEQEANGALIRENQNANNKSVEKA